MRALYIVLFVAAFGMIGCGEVQTQIVESSVQFNTDDTKGPYQVMSIITHTGPTTVSLVYSTDNWKTNKRVQMENVLSVGEDVFRGTIPGQTAGTTIHYYVEALDEAGSQVTDPVIVPPQTKGVAYKFSIITNP